MPVSLDPFALLVSEQAAAASIAIDPSTCGNDCFNRLKIGTV
jgi:hypothetical protein